MSEDTSNQPELLLPTLSPWQRVFRTFSRKDRQIALEYLCDYHIPAIVAAIMSEAEATAEEHPRADTIEVVFSYPRIPVGLRNQTSDFAVVPALYKALKLAVAEPCRNVDTPRPSIARWEKVSDAFDRAIFVVTFRNLRATLSH